MWIGKLKLIRKIILKSIPNSKKRYLGSSKQCLITKQKIVNLVFDIINKRLSYKFAEYENYIELTLDSI